MTSPPRRPEKSYLSAAVDSISPWTASRSSTQKSRGRSESEPRVSGQQGVDHVFNYRHGLSYKKYPKDCPPVNTRWFYAIDVPKRKPRLLKDTHSESRPLSLPKKFVPFSINDSRSIETAYQKLVEKEESGGPMQSSEDDSPKASLGAASSQESASINGTGQLGQRAGTLKVSVNEDFLFEVDIENRELVPVYWLGPVYEVRRGSWFYQEGSILRPCEENLAAQLEEGYLKVKPFRYPKAPEKFTSKSTPLKNGDDAKSIAVLCNNSVADSNEKTPPASFVSLKAENQRGLEDAASDSKDMPPYVPPEPQTHRLFGTYMNSVATYQDEAVAWLSSDGIMSRVSSTVYQRFAGGGYLGGVKLVRGYTDSGKTTKTAESKHGLLNPSSIGRTEQPSNPGLQPDERQQRLLKRRSAPPGTSPTPDRSESRCVQEEPAEPLTQEDVLKRQLSSLVIDSMDPEKTEEAARRQDENEMQNDYSDREGEDQSRKIDHLILVTHGIGQRLGMRTESVNFVHDANILRQTLKTVYANSADLQALNSELDQQPKNCRIQVLPVCWRHLLDFPRRGPKHNRKEYDLADTSGEDDDYPSLEDITIDGVPFIRSLITDLALDILLYQSAYREQITKIVLRECNRLFKLFVERNPYFDGKVSLIGHSLGSAILFDILCRQKENFMVYGSARHAKRYHSRPKPHTQGEKDKKNLDFDFEVEDFYCLGSPIGLFQMLKGRTIAARHHPGAFPTKSPMDPDYKDDPFSTSNFSTGEDISWTTGLPVTISSPKCSQLYNIFHPSDPIAYRLEPLIAPAMSLLKPQALPYTKKGIFGGSASQGLTGIGARVGQSVSGFWATLSSGIASSLLNRSLGLSGEDVASIAGAQQPVIRNSQGPIGVNTSGGVVSNVSQEHANEKIAELVENTAAADREGDGTNAPTFIADEIETLYSGFKKTRGKHSINENHITNREQAEAEEKGRKLRREELKVRGLNKNGRVDFSIQESSLDFNPISTIASHLSYWSDEDVSHFIMSQLLSRHRVYKRQSDSDHASNLKS